MTYKLSEFGVEFNKSKLENEVPVFGFFRKGMLVCVRVAFFAGSRFDDIPGTAHFLEHMLVAGTEKFPTKDKLAIPLERVGGGFSASTNIDSVRLNISVPQKEDLNIGLEILNEMIWHSLFENKTIENERGSIIAEIGQNEEDPYYVLDTIYSQMAFKKTPWEKNVRGNKESVSKIQKDDLLKFKEKFFTAGRMSVLVSGGVTPDEYLPLFNQYLGGFKPKKLPTLPPIAPITRENFIDRKPFRNNKQVYARIGFRTMGWNENDREMASLDVAADVLGSGRASRLLKELRYKKGLVYGAGAGHGNFVDAGHFRVSTSFEHDKLEEVLRITIDELKKLGEKGLNEEELEFAKSSITKSVFNDTQTSWSWINIHEYEMMLNPERAKLLTDYMNEIDSLTLEEVNGAIKKYIHKDNFYLALVGTDKEPKVEW